MVGFITLQRNKEIAQSASDYGYEASDEAADSRNENANSYFRWRRDTHGNNHL